MEKAERRIRSLPTFKPRRLLAAGGFAATIVFLPQVTHAESNQENKSDSVKKIVTLVKAADWQDILGPRMSDVVEVDGIPHVFFQNGMVEQNSDTDIKLSDTADWMHNIGKDGVLSKELGVPPALDPPPLSQKLHGLLNFEPTLYSVPTPVSDYVSKVGSDLPTAATQIGDQSIYRFSKVAVALNPDGSIQPLPIGEIAVKENLIPDDKKIQPTDDPDIQLSLVDRLNLSYNQGGLHKLVRQSGTEMGISGDDAETIVGCESRFDPNAQNRSGASGLWQALINNGHRAVYKLVGANMDSDWRNPVISSAAAVIIRYQEGLGAWDCARRFGIHLKYPKMLIPNNLLAFWRELGVSASVRLWPQSDEYVPW